MSVSRFRELFDTTAVLDPIDWPDLFREFSIKRPFLHNQHPGWSPAEFDPPLRALQNVKTIRALVLDYDNKTKSGDRVTEPVTIESVAEQLGDYYGLIHTSRNHTSGWSRFRVILPLTRSVSRFEYAGLWSEAARRWPGLDPAPKDPSRFWYTPGVGDHDGAEFEAVMLTGAFLNPDELLEPRVIVERKSSGPPDSQMETRARAYIEKMPPAISGAGGHDALWAVTRKLVADFGLDEHSAFRILSTEYNNRCQPAWTERELKHKIKEASEKAKVRNPIEDRALVVAHTPVAEVVSGTSDDWKKNLRYDSKDSLTKDVGNAALVLKNAPGFRGCLAFDTLSYRVKWRDQPEYEVGLDAPLPGANLQDHHAAYVQQVFSKLYGLSIGKDTAWQAMETVAHENPFHPLRDYLNGLEWDNRPRLDKWLHRYVGADDTPYNSAVGRWWLISAVARAMQPGCQTDHVLILEGGQGKGKSQAVRTLGGEWTLGALPDIRDHVRAAATIGGKWIIEIAELDALKGAGMTRIKDFVSQQVDTYRPAYGHADVDRPRCCVFVGTTNEHTYLNDPTGARRFWPVKVVGKVQRAALGKDRDQLWAECVLAYRAGEQWHPTDEYVDVIEQEQADRYAEDDWTGLIAGWLNAGETEFGFTVEQVLRGPLNMDPRFWDKVTQMRLSAILTKLGYVKKRPQINGSREYRYFKA